MYLEKLKTETQESESSEETQKYGNQVADGISKATGIGQSTFSSWKARRNLISGEKAKLIADYFNVSVDYLMTGEEKDGGETYYARNERVDEKAAEDGGRAERTQAADGSLALKSESGGGESPVLLKQSMPKVLGVLVTARGAGSDPARAQIISAVQAVLNVPVHRVAVLEKA